MVYLQHAACFVQRISFSWDKTLHQWVVGSRRFGQRRALTLKVRCALGVEDSIVLRNVGFQLPIAAATCTNITESAATCLRKSEVGILRYILEFYYDSWGLVMNRSGSF